MPFVDIEPDLEWTCGADPGSNGKVPGDVAHDRELPAVIAADDDDEFEEEDAGVEFGATEADDFADFDEDDFDDDFDDDFEEEVEGEYDLDDEEYPGDILGGNKDDGFDSDEPGDGELDD